MSEDFLHYIWKFQLFDKKNLVSVQGEPINIISVGTHNKNAGPDFLNAEIKLDGLRWHGHVEIHLNEKDWFNHKHHEDDAYKNVILHVVWNAQKAKTSLTTIQLKDLVSLDLLSQYENFISSSEKILCSSQIRSINSIEIFQMQEKALVKRLERKSREIIDILKRRNNDWEQTTFEILGRSFGFKINNEVFRSLCERIPYKTVRKISSNIFQLEALFFGLSGLLESIENKDEYVQDLQSEYQYLRKKYSLKTAIKAIEWKFLRSRPQNFPTVRLAQFAALIHKHQNLFSSLVMNDTSRKTFNVKASEYWQEHFRFGIKSEKATGKIGVESQKNLEINVLAPLTFSYGLYYKKEEFKEKAINQLESISPEKNYITKEWISLGINPTSAAQSQSLIELYNEFCTRKKCLSCSIGSQIVQHS